MVNYRVSFQEFDGISVVYCENDKDLINELIYIRSKGYTLDWISTFVVVNGYIDPDINDKEPVDDQGLPF